MKKFPKAAKDPNSRLRQAADAGSANICLHIRSQRLRLVGTGPKVEQLQEGRFRLTFTCTATNPNEAWMNGNKDQIMTAYGTSAIRAEEHSWYRSAYR